MQVQLDTFVRRLADLDTTQLADLLARRPDSVAGLEPDDLGELAERLVHPYSLATALHDLPLPALQVLEAAIALGDGCRVDDLVAFLATDPADHTGPADGHRTDVHTVLDTLHELMIVTRTGDRLELPDTLQHMFPDPLGLGQSMASLLADKTVDAMRRIGTVLGLPAQKKRAETVQALVDHFADPDNVAALLAEAPDMVRVGLERLGEEHWSDRAWRARQQAIDWAGPRGLLLQSGYTYDWRLPSEVARALRGKDFRAPFAPRPPVIIERQPDAATVARESSAAATTLASGLLAVLDHLVQRPVPALKSGGLGARELTKLAKAVGTDERSARLVLELADALDLLDTAGPTIAVSAQFATWRDTSPEAQFAGAVSAWWALGFTPTEAHDADGKVQRVLVRRGERCHGCEIARRSMLAALAGIGATDRASLAGRVQWLQPGAHPSPFDEPLADQWGEAQLLGVVADGSLSELGRALLSAGADTVGEALLETARTLLPAVARHATFGSDLTVFVAGSPSSRITSVLDAAADREGRGGAVTWRFSPASVRRAFDDGATSDGLLADLAAVSQAPLPQPLRYLIADIDRRHGHLRLSAATSVVCSDDAALLALVAADRKLAKHGLRLLAPTVLAAAVPVDTLLRALRSAGYLPIVESSGADAAPANESSADEQAASLRAIRSWAEKNVGPLGLLGAPEPAGPPDLPGLAARLKAGIASRSAPSGTTQRVLQKLNRTLSVAEIRQLAHAIDTRGRVGIEYVAASGGSTRRVIAEPDLAAPSLLAWCELRSDDRAFTVSRIVAVAPAD